MVSIVRFAIVLAAAVIVWVVGLGFGARWLARRLGRGAGSPESGPPRWVGRVALALMVLSVVVVAWSFVEPYFPVVELVRELDPHVIVFTGDGINSEEAIPVFRRTMRALTEIAPVFGVRGNWESWWFTHVDSFDGSGIEELSGEGVPLAVAGQEIWLGGIAVDSEHEIEHAVAAMPEDRYRVFLHHYPAAWKLLDGKVDLLLSGDTHGGQIVLPFLGPLVRIARWDGRFYESGLARLGDLWVYVNRGIGMEGGGVPRTRFLCPPEVTLIELVPDEGPSQSGTSSP